MHIYAIGDLHLSGEPPRKPMSVFGPNWENHWQKIKHSWQKQVTDNDLVIICGDTSWAIKLDDALPDLLAINSLPGGKIFVRGNHDYWWTSVSKMKAALDDSCFFLHNNFYATTTFAICGSRGWLTPQAEIFAEQDKKIYEHELTRIEYSLNAAKEAGYTDIILALHYPPLYADAQPTGFSALCEKYQVKYCLYGHLHDADISIGYQGNHAGTNYSLVSADALDFQLKKIF